VETQQKKADIAAQKKRGRDAVGTAGGAKAIRLKAGQAVRNDCLDGGGGPNAHRLMRRTPKRLMTVTHNSTHN
jgi:hypothetical protein